MSAAAMAAVYDGVDEEYTRLRRDRGLLDLRGAGLFEVSGAEAVDFLDHVCTRSPGFLMEGRTLAALLLDESGSLVAEVLLACAGESYTVEVWPAQREAAWRHLEAQAAARDGVTVRDLSDEVAVFGVEGPYAHLTVQPFLDSPVNELAYKHVTTVTWRGEPLVVSRTGVTAEYGYVLRTSRALGEELRESLVDNGARPCGAQAVSICRMESRFNAIEDEAPRPSPTPFELTMQWLIDFNHEFLGKQALLETWGSGQLREPVCFAAPEGAALRAGDPVTVGDTEVGRVAHAVWSPGLDTAIGVAHLDRDLAAVGLGFTARTGGGDEVRITTRSAPFVVPTSLGVKQGV